MFKNYKKEDKLKSIRIILSFVTAITVCTASLISCSTSTAEKIAIETIAPLISEEINTSEDNTLALSEPEETNLLELPASDDVIAFYEQTQEEEPQETFIEEEAEETFVEEEIEEVFIEEEPIQEEIEETFIEEETEENTFDLEEQIQETAVAEDEIEEEVISAEYQEEESVAVIEDPQETSIIDLTSLAVITYNFPADDTETESIEPAAETVSTALTTEEEDIVEKAIDDVAISESSIDLDNLDIPEEEIIEETIDEQPSITDERDAETDEIIPSETDEECPIAQEPVTIEESIIQEPPLQLASSEVVSSEELSDGDFIADTLEQEPLSDIVTANRYKTNNVNHIDGDNYTYSYHWELDVPNTEYAANINTPDSIYIDGYYVYPVNTDANYYLNNYYNIYLADGDASWDDSTVTRFYELLTELPSVIYSRNASVNSIWYLTDSYLSDDILFNKVDNYYIVYLSKAAVENATPRIATINNQSTTHYSKRLFNALIRFYTDNGYDSNACEAVLNNNFGCSFYPASYSALTSGITNEGDSSFMEFLPEEKVLILEYFEAMPKGMHYLDALKYIVRRTKGTVDPIYPSAAAVTWTYADEPYIEFMDDAFFTSFEDTTRLLIHEKTHIYWTYYLSESLKDMWYEVGGWYLENNTWYTSKQTEFVSAYAHDHNPDEDFAETVAFYITDPYMLKSRSISKYNFIKDYIMNGTYFLTDYREDLSFEVFDSDPDYIYPGQVQSVDVTVYEDLYNDKVVDIDIYLYDSPATDKEGANWGSIRLEPENNYNNCYYDISVDPVDDEKLHLKGSTVISKNSPSGYYYNTQLRFGDLNGNERYETNEDCLIQVYVDNPLEDKESPVLDINSLKLDLRDNIVNGERAGQYLYITFDYHENIKLSRVLVRLVNTDDMNSFVDLDHNYSAFIDEIQERITFTYFIPEIYSSGTYRVSMISLIDEAKNLSRYQHWELINNEIEIVTSNEDRIAPMLDLNDIIIEATPVNAITSDGQTYVSIECTITDNSSGWAKGIIKFRDPNGNDHSYWLSLPEVLGDDRYLFRVTLPVGSIPGVWNTVSIQLVDNAMNAKTYNFLEIIEVNP